MTQKEERDPMWLLDKMESIIFTAMLIALPFAFVGQLVMAIVNGDYGVAFIIVCLAGLSWGVVNWAKDDIKSDHR